MLVASGAAATAQGRRGRTIEPMRAGRTLHSAWPRAGLVCPSLVDARDNVVGLVYVAADVIMTAAAAVHPPAAGGA